MARPTLPLRVAGLALVLQGTLAFTPVGTGHALRAGFSALRGPSVDTRTTPEECAPATLYHARRARRKSILQEVDGLGARLEPRMTRLHSRARAAIRDGNYDLANEIYHSIIDRLPAQAEVSPSTKERTFLLLALNEQRKQRIDVARRIFNKGIVRFPHSTKLLVALALMESKHGDLEKAIKLVRKAGVRNPERCGMLLKWKIFQRSEKSNVDDACT